MLPCTRNPRDGSHLTDTHDSFVVCPDVGAGQIALPVPLESSYVEERNTTAGSRPSVRYPDQGQPLEDAAILRNAILFTTAQRAFSARLLLQLPLDRFDALHLSFAAVDAFCAEMTASEDVLGWLFVFKGWKPGTAKDSVFALLDRVRVGVSPWTEDAAIKLLDSLNPDEFRRLLHIPSDQELVEDGWALDLRDRLSTAIPANLDGLKRLVELRHRDNRGRVLAFNKLKHMLLALPTTERGKNEVLVPKWMRMASDGIHLQNVWLEASEKNVRLMASRAIIAQSVLNTILGIVLWTRFGAPYEAPQWALDSLSLPGWYVDNDRAEA